MTAPLPDDAGILGKLLAGTVAALTAIGAWIFRYTHSRIERMETSKADKEAFDRLAGKVEAHTISKDAFEQHVKSDERQLGEINGEIGVQRANIAKIFDKLEDVRNVIDTKHIELLNAIHAIREK